MRGDIHGTRGVGFFMLLIFKRYSASPSLLLRDLSIQPTRAKEPQ